ncbi:hypothetical protein F5Y10DRAFT_125067 [Nemania abortiva]|nr:hypothetical protein F5Y10DRAFT_125067 [Nemania abortiva]
MSKPSAHIGHIEKGTNGFMEDLEPAGKKKKNLVFLQVIDASYDGKIQEVDNEFLWTQDIYEEMKRLSQHKDDSARILNVTVHFDFRITGLRDTEGPEETRTAREGLIRFLQETYTPLPEPPPRFDSRRTFRWLNDPLLVNDIGSISSQWSQKLGSGNTHFYRLVNRTSLQQDPLDFDLHPRDSYLTCARDEKNRLIVIIVNDVWSTQEFCMNTTSKDREFKNPRSISSIKTGNSWVSLSDGSLETFAKLLVLDFFEASIYLQPVDYYEKLIYPQSSEKREKEDFKLLLTKNPHLQVPLGLFEPRLSAKSKEAFKEIEDAEGILRSVNNLVDSIACVADDLKTTDTPDPKKSDRKEYERRLRKLTRLYTERQNNAQRALEALNRQLDYLTKRHAIREAKAIKILTILASLYLPLSLSASLLGMQSPFKDIAHDRTLEDDPARLVGTNLLFDFFGVFVILGTITVFIVYTIRLGIYLHVKGSGVLPKHFNGPFSIVDYGKRWRFEGRGGNILRFLGLSAKWFIGGVFGIVLLTIFLMGMLRNAQSAWTTAQWFFIAYVAFSFILIVSYLGLYSVLYRYKLGSGWSKVVRHSILRSAN